MQHNPVITAYLKQLEFTAITQEAREQLDICYDALLNDLVDNAIETCGVKKRTVQAPQAYAAAYGMVNAKAVNPGPLCALLDRELTSFNKQYVAPTDEEKEKRKRKGKKVE